jgi:hypothetical protein
VERGVLPPYCCGNGMVMNCVGGYWTQEACNNNEGIEETCGALGCS